MYTGPQKHRETNVQRSAGVSVVCVQICVCVSILSVFVIVRTKREKTFTSSRTPLSPSLLSLPPLSSCPLISPPLRLGIYLIDQQLKRTPASSRQVGPTRPFIGAFIHVWLFYRLEVVSHYFNALFHWSCYCFIL